MEFFYDETCGVRRPELSRLKHPATQLPPLPCSLLCLLGLKLAQIPIFLSIYSIGNRDSLNYFSIGYRILK